LVIFTDNMLIDQGKKVRWHTIAGMLCLLFNFQHGIAQEKFHSRLHGIDTHSKELKVRTQSSFDSPQARDAAIAGLVPILVGKGYIEASVDSMMEVNDTLHIYIHSGPLYKIVHTIQGENLTEDIPGKRKNGHDEGAISDPGMLSEKLNVYANTGYPFARLYNDAMQWSGDTLFVQSRVERGPLVTIDSVVNRGTAKISSGFLHNYLGIKPGQPFNEHAVREAERLLAAIPFTQYARPPQLYFRRDKADIWLYLDKRRLSRFDFLIGVLPNNQETGKVMVTGDVALQLYNAFGRGEQLKLEWQKLQGSSQQLRILVNFPYILRSPIGAYATFKLEKRDTSYLNLNWKLGVPYSWKGGNYLRAYVENLQTIVLSVDTNVIKGTRRLPAILDASSILYGIECSWSTLDYPYNPSRGMALYSNIALGNKKLKENNTIANLSLPLDPEFSFSSLYDSLGRKSLKASLEWMIAGYIPVSERHVLKLATIGRAMLNNSLLDNEIPRIGGNKLLRGFDEESILSTVYNIATAEYRFLLDRNAFFNVFFDAAYSKTKAGGVYKNDFPFGFGAGVNFETKAGIFGLSYAMGRQLGNPIDFRSAKLHFGYVNIF
jgi:outer membrane protein assembly factor BamA